MTISRIYKNKFLGFYFVDYVENGKVYSSGFHTLKEAKDFKKTLKDKISKGGEYIK